MQPVSRRSMLYGSAAVVGTMAFPGLAEAQRGSANGAGATNDAHPRPPANGAIANDTEWRHFAGNLNSQRYSPLEQINASNFSRLQPVWRLDTDRFGPRPEGNYESTPLLIKGRLFVTAGSRRDVLSLDAATGEILWMHTEDEGQRGRGAPRALSGHGVSYWTDGTKERIIYVTAGYRMLSLDANTGIPDPDFGVNGVVDLRLNDDQDMDLITADLGLHSTPLIVGDIIAVGAALSAGDAPKSVYNAKGFVRGFDARTGKRLWIFHTIPQKGEFGYDTWIIPGQAEKTGNTGSWAEMSADEELGLLYIGVELPTGDYTGIYRAGPALFGESIVALDIKTGVRKWHYQMVHHGLWDRDVPCAAILCDIPVKGKIVKALAQPSKQAFLYVLDRTTGKPVWPIPEVKVPKGDVPGEWYSPTQPIPSKPPAYDRQNVGDDDLVDFTPAIKARAKEIADHYVRGTGVFTPPTTSTVDGKWGTLAVPGSQGGTNWPGGSFDPETNIVYVFSKTQPFVIGIVPNSNPNSDFKFVHGTARAAGAPPPAPRRGPPDAGADAGAGPGGARGEQRDPGEGGPVVSGPSTLEGAIRPGLAQVAGLPIVKPPYGRITALDLKNGSLAWQIAHGETPDNIKNHPLLKGLNIPRTGQAANIGPLVTKSLVICGDGGTFTDEQGRNAARLRAYDKASGKELGAVFMDGAQTGTPMTYGLGGWQYVVLATTHANGGSQLVAYRLPSV